jgi:hypothetical protein
MKNLIAAVFASATLLAALGISAAEPKQTPEKSEPTPAEQAAAEETEPASAPARVSAPPPAATGGVVYRPPKLGKPAQTVGGGSRGTSDKVPVLFVVTPDHVGQTTSAQPSVFWYIDQVPDASFRIEFTLLDEESVEPLVEKTLATPKRAGIHRIRLADYGVQLAPGTEYEWSVALILDPNERSKDIVVTGWIDRVEPSEQLASRLETEDRAGIAAVYADEGLWYDAVAALSDQIDRTPADARLQQQRAHLLRQVGLDEVAGDASR